MCRNEPHTPLAWVIARALASVDGAQASHRVGNNVSHFGEFDDAGGGGADAVEGPAALVGHDQQHAAAPA